jgi:hypothetical protein
VQEVELQRQHRVFFTSTDKPLLTSILKRIQHSDPQLFFSQTILGYPKINLQKFGLFFNVEFFSTTNLVNFSGEKYLKLSIIWA